jgi:hypothetical protein
VFRSPAQRAQKKKRKKRAKFFFEFFSFLAAIFVFFVSLRLSLHKKKKIFLTPEEKTQNLNPLSFASRASEYTRA